jgi:hypothetical protein
MRSMVEGPPRPRGPSTALRAVSLPIGFADGEDEGVLPELNVETA